MMLMLSVSVKKVRVGSRKREESVRAAAAGRSEGEQAQKKPPTGIVDRSIGPWIFRVRSPRSTPSSFDHHLYRPSPPPNLVSLHPFTPFFLGILTDRSAPRPCVFDAKKTW